MIQNFENGSTLITGDDFFEHLFNIMNNKNNYDTDCSFCNVEYDPNNERCEDCSIPKGLSCSCHINPPCIKCENSKFEVSPFLINYKRYKAGGKTVWECFKSNKKTFLKLNEIEERGFELNAETLTTGEISICITDLDEEMDIAIEICEKINFKDCVTKLINEFEI
jgi:hypothetical protein